MARQTTQTTGRGRILEAIAGLQSAVIAGDQDMRAAFSRALDVLLDATGSPAGFIGEVGRRNGETPVLTVLAAAGITGDEAWSEVARLAEAKGLRFKHGGANGPSETGEAAASNAGAPADLPDHPALAGVPLSYGGEMVGLVGLAMRDGAEDAALADDLAPLATALAAMLVAERAKAESEHQRRRAELALVGSDAAVWDWDVKTGEIWWSPSLKASLGMAPEDAPDFEVFLDKVHPDDRDRIEPAIEAVLTGETQYRIAFRLRRTDGGYATVRSSGQMVYDAFGSPERLVGVHIDISREVELEAQAREAGEFSGVAQAAAGLASWRWDGASETMPLDARFAALVEQPELEGRPLGREAVLRAVHPDDRGFVESELSKVLDGRSTAFAREHRLLTPSGRTVWVRAHAGRIRQRGNGAPVVAGIVVDRTEAKGQEMALAEANRRYELAVNGSRIAIWDWDVRTGELVWSEEFETLLGLRPEDQTGRIEDFTDRIHPEDVDRVHAALDRHFEHGEVYDLTFRMRHASGRYVPIHARGDSVRDVHGSAVRMAGSALDLTAAREAERALAHAKERYDLAVGASHMAIWDQNMITGEVYWSARMGEILGLGRREGRESREAFTARMHPDDRERVSKEFRALIEEDVPYDVTVRLRRADGGYVPVRSRCGALRDESGRAVRVCGSISDISGEVMARARADLAVEAARLGIWDWDLVTGVMTADARFAAMLGRPWLAQQPGPVEQPLRLIHDDDRADAEAWFNELAEGRIDRAEFEHRAVHPDGKEIWLGGYASVIDRGADGRPRRVLGVFEDRTARKRAEMEISKAKQRYDLAVTGSLMAIWDVDLETGRVYASPRLAEMLGRPPEPIETRIEKLYSRIRECDLKKMRAAARRHVDEGEPFAATVRLARNDGTEMFGVVRGQAERDADGKPVRFAGSLIDITAERAAESAARRAGAHAQLALKAAHLGVWELDARPDRITMDAVLADIIGAPDLAGKACTPDEIMAFTHPDDHAAIRAGLSKIFRRELQTLRSEQRLIRPDGSLVWIQADWGVAEYAEDGRVARLIGIVQDLTEQKAAERALQDSADAAREANEAKTRFLATMSHEIRTPLNGVLGIVQLLGRTDLDARQRRYVETIAASGRTLSNVIDEVLDISRIEAGRLELNLKPARVADMLAEAAAPMEAQAAEKGLALTVEVDPALAAPVLIDAPRMAQAAGNLIANAVKFTEKGGVRVTARAAGKRVVRIEVSDDGPGVDPSMQEAVFDRFVQADMSNRRVHGGSGLGLAIVRELVQLAGGVVGVVSEPGRGACFWMEFPAPLARTPSVETNPEEADANPSLRILVVEDQAINRAVLAEILAEAGHVCETADTGGEALSALRQRSYDAVLMDLHMPGMSGDEALAHIRAGEAGPKDMPVYFVTADATPEAHKRVDALGADGLFVKPVDADRILGALRTVALKRRRVG